MRTCVALSGPSLTLVESHAPQRLSSTPGKIGDVFWLSLILSGSSMLDLGAGRAPMTRRIGAEIFGVDLGSR